MWCFLCGNKGAAPCHDLEFMWENYLPGFPLAIVTCEKDFLLQAGSRYAQRDKRTIHPDSWQNQTGKHSQKYNSVGRFKGSFQAVPRTAQAVSRWFSGFSPLILALEIDKRLIPFQGCKIITYLVAFGFFCKGLKWYVHQQSCWIFECFPYKPEKKTFRMKKIPEKPRYNFLGQFIITYFCILTTFSHMKYPEFKFQVRISCGNVNL